MSRYVVELVVPYFWLEISVFQTSKATDWANRRHISQVINPQPH